MYKHFTDKYDILNQCIDEQLASFLDGCGTGSIETLTFQTFDYLYQHRKILNLLLNAAGEGVLHEKLLKAFQRNAYLHEITTGSTKIYEEIKSQYIVSALSGVFEWWLTSSEKYTVEEACGTLLSILAEFFPNQKH